jgi:predicted ATP-binding protein involved in virulence
MSALIQDRHLKQNRIGYQQLHEYYKKVERGIERKENPTLPVIAKFGTQQDQSGSLIPYQAKATRLEAGYAGALETNSEAGSFLAWFKTFEDEARKFNQEYVNLQLQMVKQAITDIIPEWTSVAFSFHEDDLVGMFFGIDGKTNLRMFRDLSDGYRRVISMVANIAYRCVRLNPHLRENAIRDAEGVVLIDEIDQHLHPTWQRKIVGDLKRVFPRLQFIVTTHSPFVVQSLEADEIINLDVEGRVEVNPKDMSLEDVAEDIMGVESAYGVENQEREAISKEYFELLGTEEEASQRGKSQTKAPSYRGVDAPKEEKEKRLDDLEAKMSDPTMRAFLQMKRLKKKS